MAITIDQVKKRIAQSNSVAFAYRDDAVSTPQELICLLKAVSGFNFDFGQTVVEHRGANSMYPYAADITMSNSKITFTAKEFPPKLMNLGLNTVATEGAAEPAGNIGELEDVTSSGEAGTELTDSTKGLGAIAETLGQHKRDGTYIIKVVSASTIDIYPYDDADDINMAFEELGKVNATPYTMTSNEGTGAETVITELGITITAGTAVDMTTGDTAKLVIRKDNLGYISNDIGVATTAGYVKAIFSQKPQTGGTITRSTFTKCLVSVAALDIPDGENATMQITVTPVIDPNNSNKTGTFEWNIGTGA